VAATNDDHVPSGAGVFPPRASTAKLVPVGVSAVHDAVPQSVAWPLSNTRDVKLPDPA
jgi:hypothetical protein